MNPVVHTRPRHFRERLGRAVPVEDWWREARDCARSPEVQDAILDMYRKSAMLSPKIPAEYREFWQIDEWPYGLGPTT